LNSNWLQGEPSNNIVHDLIHKDYGINLIYWQDGFWRLYYEEGIGDWQEIHHFTEHDMDLEHAIISAEEYITSYTREHNITKAQKLYNLDLDKAIELNNIIPSKIRDYYTLVRWVQQRWEYDLSVTDARILVYDYYKLLKKHKIQSALRYFT
jgi:hypothetical protein